MPTDEILDVHHVSNDSDSYIVRCPHCKNVIGVEGEDLSEIRGEQYTCRCGGWLQIADNARYISEHLFEELIMRERPCCGTFAGSPHRKTCSQYRGKD